MTKVIILGDTPPVEEKPKKPIEFVRIITHNMNLDKPTNKPGDWKNIEVIARGYRNSLGNFDIFFAYDDHRRSGALYLGHYNDGVV